MELIRRRVTHANFTLVPDATALICAINMLHGYNQLCLECVLIFARLCLWLQWIANSMHSSSPALEIRKVSQWSQQWTRSDAYIITQFVCSCFSSCYSPRLLLVLASSFFEFFESRGRRQVGSRREAPMPRRISSPRCEETRRATRKEF